MLSSKRSEKCLWKRPINRHHLFYRKSFTKAFLQKGKAFVTFTIKLVSFILALTWRALGDAVSSIDIPLAKTNRYTLNNGNNTEKSASGFRWMLFDSSFIFLHVCFAGWYFEPFTFWSFENKRSADVIIRQCFFLMLRGVGCLPCLRCCVLKSFPKSSPTIRYKFQVPFVSRLSSFRSIINFFLLFPFAPSCVWFILQ